MYNKVECVVLTCDNCQDTYENDHSGFSIYSDENAASEDADNDGWYLHCDDGKQYCRACHSFDDNDVLFIDKTRFKEPAQSLVPTGEESKWNYIGNSDLPNDASGVIFIDDYQFKKMHLGIFRTEDLFHRKNMFVNSGGGYFELDKVIKWMYAPKH